MVPPFHREVRCWGRGAAAHDIFSGVAQHQEHKSLFFHENKICFTPKVSSCACSRTWFKERRLELAQKSAILVQCMIKVTTITRSYLLKIDMWSLRSLSLRGSPLDPRDAWSAHNWCFQPGQPCSTGPLACIVCRA